MKRKDCFFGLHFDYHANKDTQNIGKDFDEKVLEKIVTEVKPDFIQCDTKGHPGYSSYYTKVGSPAPHLTCDLLKKWREITKKYNVLLFSHYSGIWDKKATADHNDWAEKNFDGEAKDKASPLGEYVDKLLIPQLVELAKDYQIDGAWVDGECWALEYDFQQKALNEFYNQTGIKISKDNFEDYKKQYAGFMRQLFFKYVKHYIEEIKKQAPDFELTSNWMNTAWVPDNLTYSDYISGDLSPTNSVDSARFDGRIMQSFGRTWDIMSWGISFPIHYAKSDIQLEQEASIIMALGGGFQVYNMQSPNKVVMDEWAIPIWAKVSKFCRDRKQFCHHGIVEKDVGMIYSTKAYYNSVEDIFYRDCTYNMEMYGNMLALLDMGRVVSVINSDKLTETNLSEYKTLFVSNLDVIEDDLKLELLNYAKNGGELILAGSDTVKLFANELQIRVDGSEIKQPVVMIDGDDYAVEVRKPYVKIDGNFDSIVNMHECVVDGDLLCYNPPPSITAKKESIPAFVSMGYGKGKVHLMTVNVGKYYLDDRTYELLRFYRDCLKGCSSPLISTNKNGQVEVVVTNKNGKKYIHLINLLGEHRSQTIKTFSDIPPLTNVTVKMELNKAPKVVKLQPENKEVKYVYKEGILKINLSKVSLYTIIEIE